MLLKSLKEGFGLIFDKVCEQLPLSFLPPRHVAICLLLLIDVENYYFGTVLAACWQRPRGRNYSLEYLTLLVEMRLIDRSNGSEDEREEWENIPLKGLSIWLPGGDGGGREGISECLLFNSLHV